MASRRETEYLVVDVVFIAIIFLAGASILVLTWFVECWARCKKSDYDPIREDDQHQDDQHQDCCTKWTLSRRLSSFLINMLYGNGTQLVTEPTQHKRGPNNQVDQLKGGQSNQKDNMINIRGYPITSDHRCLRCCLSSNAIIITTLLLMIFADRYILTNEYGCIVGKDCYPLDGDFNEFPIENCTQFENSNITTVCYSYNLVFLDAVSDTGGILVMITLLTVLMTKSIIYCLKNRCLDKAKRCCFYFIRVIIVVVVIIVETGYVVYIHKCVLHHQHNVPLRLGGSIMQYIAILLTFSITTLTPWYLLVISDESLPNCCRQRRTDGYPNHISKTIWSATHHMFSKPLCCWTYIYS